MSASDQRFMEVALAVARRSVGCAAPNPPVGAMLVRFDDAGPEVVARGWTARGGRPHAEREALARAGARAQGATLYVTLEPCAHRGETPPCADAIVKAGVARVVCALRDPDPRTDGKGLDRLARAGIEVVVGPGAEEARWLALGHILRVTANRPIVQLKLAVAADGLMAAGRGAPVWVTGEAARAQAHLLRARADAILVGRGTVEADDPELTCRLPGLEERSPVRVVLDGGLRVSPQAKVLREADRVPVWLVCAADSPAARVRALAGKGIQIIKLAQDKGGRLDLAGLLAALSERGITRLLVEGGPTVARAFLDADLVDEAVFFHGVGEAGAGGIAPFGDAGLERVTESGQFVVHGERAVDDDRMIVLRRKR